MAALLVTAFNQKKRIVALWLLALLFLAVAVSSRPAIGYETGLHEFLEITGLGFVFVAIGGRLWSILYIGTQKNRALVTAGPYSMTRNPLYFFSLTGIFGIGLMFGSLLLAFALAAVCCGVFLYTARREAAYLHGLFGEAYDGYAARTPMLVPDPRLYRGPAEVTFSPAALATTFFDSLFLIALLPLFEGLEAAQAAGYLTPLFLIP